jgi:FkbM family methyltransferase
MSTVSRIRSRLAHRLWWRLEAWAPHHPDVVLHDPRAGSRQVQVNIPARFSVAGRTIEVPVQNMRQYKRWRSAAAAFCTADPAPEQLSDVYRWLKENLADDSVLYDVGANIGIISIVAGLLRPQARILSFEPEPNSYLQLCRTIIRNRINATPYPIAISARSRIGEFFVNRAFDAALSNHQLDRQTINTGESFVPAARVGAPVYALDSLVYDFGLPAPTLVKVDVDGIDPEVIEGMDRLLADHRVRGLITEATGEANVARIAAILERHGYVCVQGPPAGLGNHPCDLVYALP